MVNFRSVSAALATSALLGQAFAHPGEQHTPEQIKREISAQHRANHKMTRALEKCANNPAYLARRERAVTRRAENAKAIRQKRSIEHKPVRGKRDEAALLKWAAIDHNQTAAGYTLETPMSELFSGNATCALVEETIIGPYWVEGELIRTDISEDQGGVPLHLDLQFVDIADCSAVSDMVIDIWHCNSTGVYSGVTATGQAGLNTTWLRGAQISDQEGVAQFDTVFPGHYQGRATHIHVLTTKDATILTNQTYDGGVATHIGQFFFDQDLINAVELNAPYSDNQQELTTNVVDGIAAEEATDDYDIFMDYALLGDSAADGIMAWITVGVDMSANHTSNVEAAAHHYADGDVDTSDGVSTGPPIGGGNGTSSAAPSDLPSAVPRS